MARNGHVGLASGGEGTSMRAWVEAIFVTSHGSRDMADVPQVEALAGQGLAGDRYATRTGHWTNRDECEVTLIEGEALDAIDEEWGLAVHAGEHRRNLVTRGVRLDDLAGTRFRVGDALLAYDRPRPPCRHVERLSERGLRKALTGRGGICARVVEGGVIRAGSLVTVDASSPAAPSARDHEG